MLLPKSSNFQFFSAFRKILNVTVCQRFEFFSVVRGYNPRKFSKDVLRFRKVKTLVFIHQPDRVAQKASYVSAADWRYQTQVGNLSQIYVCAVMLSSGLDTLMSLFLKSTLPQID